LKEKKEFFNSVYFLYKSSVPIADVFKSIIQSASSVNLRTLSKLILIRIEKGHSLREAIMPYSSALGLAYSTLLCAGEEAGKLEEVLSDIIKNIVREEDIKTSIITALAYPSIIFILAIGVGLLFKFFIFKVFASFASGIDQTEISTLAISAIIKIAIVYIIMFFVAFYIFINKQLQKKLLDVISKFAGFSNLLKDYSFSNFFSVFALAYDSGIPLFECVSLSNSVINIPNINKIIKKAEIVMSKGTDVTTALASTGLFSHYAISQISAGEKAGELDKTLKNVSNAYQKQLEMSLKMMLKLIEPFMLIIVGIFVAYIAVTAYKSYFSSLFSML
jgi:type II secretory pathway component PulF